MNRTENPRLRRSPGRWQTLLRAVSALALSLSAAACSAPPPPLPHSVYVWQRQWDEPLRASLRQTRDLAASMRVLARQADPQGALLRTNVDLAALRELGLPVVAVVRLEGGMTATPLPLLLREVDTLLAEWRAAGLQVALEIDYDCASAKLVDYAQTLAALRRALPGPVTLSVTALPDWRRAAALDAVLAAVDYSVLQVHAVRSPAEGLFDAALAQQWIDEWSRRSAGKPFLVALPAYGARLKLDAAGVVEAVESEQPLSRRSAQTRELRVDPRAVASLIRTLQRRAYPNLAGFAWFRLPRENDTQAWSLRTLQAVIRDQPLRAALSAELQAQADGALDMYLHSSGNLDAALPARLRVHGDCSSGDGLGAYTFSRDADGAQFARAREGLLTAGRRQLVGWLRCRGAARVSVEE